VEDAVNSLQNFQDTGVTLVIKLSVIGVLLFVQFVNITSVDTKWLQLIAAKSVSINEKGIKNDS